MTCYINLEYPRIIKNFAILPMRPHCIWKIRRASVGDIVDLPWCRQEIWDEPEGTGAEDPDHILYCLAT